MTAPLVSVVITAFDTGPYLPETLASVFAQTHDRYEVIVVDDGSNDDTAVRARQFGDRITFSSRAHEGLGPARNAGLARATGDFVAFLDSDDLWVPETLRTQLAVAARYPESGLVVADGLEFGVDDDHRRRLFGSALARRVDTAPEGVVTDRAYRDFLAGNLVACPAQTLIPRWVVEELGEVCITPNGAQDYDYYLRISRRFPVTFHRAVLARWRFRADSMSGSRDERSLRWVGTGPGGAGPRRRLLPARGSAVPPRLREAAEPTRVGRRATGAARARACGGCDRSRARVRREPN